MTITRSTTMTNEATTPDTRLTFGRFAAIFIPFALLVSAALLRPEVEEALLHGRIIYTIWVTILFMIPSMWLLLSGATAGGALVYWRLCWTTGLLAYWLHFYFTVGGVFHGSLAEVYAAQGPIIATSNLIDTAWWTLDVALAWFVTGPRRWISVQRIAVHGYVAGTFFVSAVVIKHGVVRGLGIVMTAAALVGAVVGVVRHLRARAATRQGAGRNTSEALARA
jgi:hypothetical protein